MYEAWEKCNYYTLANLLKEKKQELERLKVPYSQSLQQSLKNLDTAFQRFFKKKAKYPRFKKKSYGWSVCYPQHTDIIDSYIKLPKIGMVKCNFHRELKGKVKRMTITKTPTWKYFVSILTDYDDQRTNGHGMVAIDVGIKEFGVRSDGVFIPNPRHLKKKLKRLKKQQRRLSRKQKWSSNRNKQRLRVARLHEEVSDCRKDFLHKTSTTIAKQYDTLVLENLRVRNMVKNHCLAQAISDMWWRTFRTMCEYKMKVIVVDPRNTSKTCSNCWNIANDLKLSDRTYTCVACDREWDRDYNASLNILARATA